MPEVPFQMLDSLGLGTAEWTEIAKNANWHMTRMNLNTFKRHGVFGTKGMVKMVADRLRDPELIANAKVFPYQLMAAYQAAEGLDPLLTNALQDAMDISLANVPEFKGSVLLCPDVSGSMSQNHVTGARAVPSKIKCIDAAGLITAAFLQKNPTALVTPFEQRLRNAKINPRDSIMTMAKTIANLGGGGTDCSLPLAYANSENLKFDTVVYISDNESWADRYKGRGTGMMHEWTTFKKRNPKAKLICIDLCPNTSVQADSSKDRLNVGGFSDTVFDVVSDFMEGSTKDHWIDLIEAIKL